jgi:hypothetical protein
MVLLKITMKGIIFPPGLFTTADPAHHADIGKALAGFLATIDVAPVAGLGVLFMIGLGFVQVFFIVHGAPRKNKNVLPAFQDGPKFFL